MTVKSDNTSQLSLLILDNIMANMLGHVYWKDTHGVYLGCNDKQAQTLGLQFGHQVIGKTDFDLPWPESSARQFHENDQRIMNNGIAEAIEEKIDELGSIVFSIKSPIKNSENKIYGILGISIDITDKKRADQLQKEKEIVQKNSEIINTLSSSIAHEVRTPLSIIKINADLLEMSEIPKHLSKHGSKKEFIERMNNIQQAIKECTQVMTMLLVKMKKLSGTVTNGTDKEICSISRTVKTALSEYPFRKNERKNIHYNEKINDFCYQGNARLTKHVLFNLLKNALSVIHDEQKGEIFIEQKLGQDFNQLLFKDTAKGISPEYLPKIFNKFETTDDAHSGTGLGLAFCKLVMESYGGKIECCSELGQFTEFVLYFPNQPLQLTTI